jgi:aspartate/methionine/tyrosine aminotransferase
VTNDSAKPRLSLRPVPRADYLLWAKRRPHPANDLARSDVNGPSLDDLPGARAALEVSGRNDEGWPPLVDAIAGRYGVGANAVATATGTSGANFLVCAAIVRPGDDVLVEMPAYDPLLAVPRMLGARVIRFERRFEEGFRLDPARVAAAITPATRLIILTSPHNPAGALTDADALRDVGRIAARHGALVLVDEIYLDVTFGPTCPPAASLGPVFVSTSSLTKLYGLSGLRCGWAIASPDVAEEIRCVRALTDGVGSVVAERASTVVFGQLAPLAANARAVLERNVATFARFMAGTPALDWVPPDGGTVAFPRLRSGEPADALAERLITKYDTAIVPGRFFEAPAHFRVALGIDSAVLDRGLDAIRSALA